MLSLNNVTVDLGHASRRCCRCDRYLFAVSFLCFQHPPPPPLRLFLLCSLFLMELLFFMEIVCNPNERARSVHPHLLCFSVFSDVTYSCVLLLQHALRELFTSYFDSNDCFPKRQFLCPKRQRFAKWTVHFAGSCLFNPEPPNLTGGLRT